jgi:hypothetical protein
MSVLAREADIQRDLIDVRLWGTIPNVADSDLFDLKRRAEHFMTKYKSSVSDDAFRLKSALARLYYTYLRSYPSRPGRVRARSAQTLLHQT